MLWIPGTLTTRTRPWFAFRLGCSGYGRTPCPPRPAHLRQPDCRSPDSPGRNRAEPEVEGGSVGQHPTARYNRLGAPLYLSAAKIAEVIASPSQFQPVRLASRREAFDHPEWLFELKYDGFRALAFVEQGRCRLVSRNGNTFQSFDGLADSLPQELRCRVPRQARSAAVQPAPLPARNSPLRRLRCPMV
jgi:hypothetical protein